MLPIRVPALLAFCLTMGAQAPAITMFEQELKSSGSGMFVILEEGQEDYSAAFRKLLLQEGVAELNLRARIVRSNERQKELNQHLRTKYGLPKGPAWMFLDATGTRIRSGGTLPQASALADDLAQAGIQSPARPLRAFVRAHPDHLEGRVALLNTLRRIAEKRTMAALGLEDDNDNGRGMGRAIRDMMGAFRPGGRGPDRGPGGGLRRPGQPEPTLPTGAAPLSPEQDVLIWAPWCQELDRLLASPTWTEAELDLSDDEEVLLEATSALVHAVYERRIGTVEEALRRWPSSVRYWNLWLRMHQVLGGTGVKALAEQLGPAPGTPAEAWPPREVKMALVREARRTGDWSSVHQILWPQWQRFSQMVGGGGGRFPGGGGPFVSRMMDGQWEQMVGPLLEALVRLGNMSLAEQVVSTCADTLKWEDLPARASAVAEGCGKPELARRWRALQVSK